MRFASNDMNTINRHEIHRRPSVGMVGILVRYHTSFSTALATQLLIVASSLAGCRTGRGLPTFTCDVGVMETLIQSSKHINVWTASITITYRVFPFSNASCVVADIYNCSVLHYFKILRSRLAPDVHPVSAVCLTTRCVSW
jgi:hypothetical protein